jgi:hypothetical protein
MNGNIVSNRILFTLDFPLPLETIFSFSFKIFASLFLANLLSSFCLGSLGVFSNKTFGLFGSVFADSFVFFALGSIVDGQAFVVVPPTDIFAVPLLCSLLDNILMVSERIFIVASCASPVGADFVGTTEDDDTEAGLDADVPVMPCENFDLVM